MLITALLISSQLSLISITMQKVNTLNIITGTNVKNFVVDQLQSKAHNLVFNHLEYFFFCMFYNIERVLLSRVFSN